MKARRQSSEFWVGPLFDADGVQCTSAIGTDGKEYPDSTPLSPPIGYEPPAQLEQLIEQLFRKKEFLAALQRGEIETPEEADDFDVDEDWDPRFDETIYEKYFEAKSKRAAMKAAAVSSETVAPRPPPVSAPSVSDKSGTEQLSSAGGVAPVKP